MGKRDTKRPLPKTELIVAGGGNLQNSLPLARFCPSSFSCCCTFATVRFEFKSAEKGLGSSSSGEGSGSRSM